MGLFSWFGRSKSSGAAPLDRAATKSDVEHLMSWAKARYGVEAYVEPQTMATETTLVLIAHDGEWTRRRVDGPAAAGWVAEKLEIPIYDAAIVGLPQRYRDYNATAKDRRRL